MARVKDSLGSFTIAVFGSLVIPLPLPLPSSSAFEVRPG